MEPFSLLKFWRNAGGSDVSSNADSLNNTTKVDVRNRAPETDVESDDDDEYEEEEEDNNNGNDEEDSFFDLVFTAPDSYDKQQVKSNVKSCVLTKESSQEDSVNNLIELELESPLKARVFTVDSNSNSNFKPQSPISLLKSAPKFRVFLLGFRKSKSSDKSEANEAPKKQNHKFQKSSQNEQSKRFTVKCKVEEVPIASLFSRDNSLRSKLQREKSFDFSINDDASKQKEVPMYLKLIKPLYIRASKRYTTTDNKLKFPWDQLSKVSPLSSPSTVPSTSPRKLSDERRGNRGAGFKVVSKHLGKSRSASSTVVGTTSSPANRRDDSLLLQHDGIQSAILHCKRSYNSTAKECSAMLRSSHGKSVNPSGNFSCERNRCSSI
ncbi:hypothetical protein ACH5RR_017179 [Cinchona calisaya]|uniref:Membrane-associated kinase regulator 2 n=1 Tax=Cinchona calisaya TaxID=153742 RepID=A0ABD2ZY13_9GENT